MDGRTDGQTDRHSMTERQTVKHQPAGVRSLSLRRLVSNESELLSPPSKLSTDGESGTDGGNPKHCKKRKVKSKLNLSALCLPLLL